MTCMPGIRPPTVRPPCAIATSARRPTYTCLHDAWCTPPGARQSDSSSYRPRVGRWFIRLARQAAEIPGDGSSWRKGLVTPRRRYPVALTEETPNAWRPYPHDQAQIECMRMMAMGPRRRTGVGFSKKCRSHAGRLSGPPHPAPRAPIATIRVRSGVDETSPAAEI